MTARLYALSPDALRERAAQFREAASEFANRVDFGSALDAIERAERLERAAETQERADV